MGNKILLIGGTGTLSTDVMRLSVNKGYSVYVLNRGNHTNSILSDVVLLKADIKNKNEINNIIKEHIFDVVIDFLSYNISDIENSLSLFKDKCHQFILISTACVYRRQQLGTKITEKSTLGNPYWDYSLNKVACEQYLINQCNKIGLNYTIIRPYITYGDTRIPYGIMPSYNWHWTLIARIQNNKPILLWDNGNAVCTLTHTTDFAKGIVGLYSNPKAYNEAFHIVSDENFTWKEVLKLIGKSINTKAYYIEIPSEYIVKNIPALKGMLLGDRSLDAIFDNSKIKEAVPEFKCTTTLELGIAKTIRYYEDNEYLNGIDYQWDAQMDKLIHNYLKEKDPKKLEISNLKFINYLSFSFSDRIIYFVHRYLPDPLISISELFINIISKIATRFKISI